MPRIQGFRNADAVFLAENAEIAEAFMFNRPYLRGQTVNTRGTVIQMKMPQSVAESFGYRDVLGRFRDAEPMFTISGELAHEWVIVSENIGALNAAFRDGRISFSWVNYGR